MTKNIAVFCGSRFGNVPEWKDWAYNLGQGIAERGWGLVFGGGSRGLMGQVSDGVFQNQGRVTGVIPENLLSEKPDQERLTELHFVKTMSERKMLMGQLSDAFVIIPGGIGTFDELFDVWATAQIGSHQKTIVLANWSGYYDPLIQFLQHSLDHGFMVDTHFEKIQIVSNVADIFSRLHPISE
ncbi:TIGR00730 family Rossman fold protein [Polynucleobacter rarus]|jgi:uncharacterized protein (TIGR00730 family)|uniref:LOG family protein n=1 Tax=Polynucleobacter rarus TaxID=556055 RepID=UPI000D3EDB19|nr:TIGR00730 family Rossman fold protein [Polynucleobacter rarus]